MLIKAQVFFVLLFALLSNIMLLACLKHKPMSARILTFSETKWVTLFKYDTIQMTLDKNYLFLNVKLISTEILKAPVISMTLSFITAA